MNSRTFDDGLHELSIALTERVYLKNPLGGGGERIYTSRPGKKKLIVLSLSHSSIFNGLSQCERC